MAQHQPQRWTPSYFLLLPKAWRHIWKDQGRGSSKGGDFQRRHSTTSGQAIDGIFSLYDFHAQIYDKHGRIQKVQSSPKC